MMSFSHPNADCYLPVVTGPAADALARVTHLCVAAHQDDIEIMAHAGISDCLDEPGKAFGGVVVTNGGGSPRTDAYSNFTDEQMQAARRDEQRRAADLGCYAIQIQLAYPSSEVRWPGQRDLATDLRKIFESCRPEVLYLHSPADKHDTHVAVLLRCIEVLRTLHPQRQPLQVLGCEVWRDLDWMPDEDKVALDSGRHSELGRSLLSVFDSQVSGGKRYDLAVLGRRQAHATFHMPHGTDQFNGITWAMDLTPLVRDSALSLREFTLGYIDRFRQNVADRISRCGGI